MNNSDRLNIAFVCDRNYAQHLAVTMRSLFENNRQEHFHVYVINTNIDDRTWKKLSEVNAPFGHQLIDKKITDRELQQIPKTEHYTQSNYFKLYIPGIVEDNRVLYLDADLIVTGSVRDLYNTELDDAFLAAVENPGFSRHQQLGMDSSAGYFNSGVMVMNLPKWRSEPIKDRVLDFTLTHPEAIVLAEQCGLNAVINGRWKELHPRYNLQTYYFENQKSASELPPLVKEAAQNPVIVHFTAFPKPWFFAGEGPYRHLYWRYLRKTPYRFYVPPDLTIKNIAKKCAAFFST